MAYFKSGGTDRVPMRVAVFLYPLLLVVAVIVWSLGFDDGVISVLWPFLFFPPLGCWGGLAGYATFTRLVVEDLPHRKGTALALASNLLTLCMMAGPLYLRVTYSSEGDTVPRVAFSGMALVHFLSGSVFLTQYARLAKKSAVEPTGSV